MTAVALPAGPVGACGGGRGGLAGGLGDAAIPAPCGPAGGNGRWKAAGCEGAVGAAGFGEGGGGALGLLGGGEVAAAEVEGAEDGAAPCGPYFASIWAIAASSALASRAMSLSGNGGRKLRNCSSRALRARP